MDDIIVFGLGLYLGNKYSSSSVNLVSFDRFRREAPLVLIVRGEKEIVDEFLMQVRWQGS